MRRALVLLLVLLPTLALAGPPKELAGDWQVKFTAEEQAQLDAMRKAAQDNPEDGLAKAMLMAMEVASQMTVHLGETTMIVAAAGESKEAPYTLRKTEAGWELDSKDDKGEAVTLKLSLADGVLAMDDGKQTMHFVRKAAKK